MAVTHVADRRIAARQRVGVAVALVAVLAMLSLTAYAVPRVASPIGAHSWAQALGPPGVPIGYGPSWLPAGLQEESRMVLPPDLDGSGWTVVRSWTSPASRQTEADALNGLSIKVLHDEQRPGCHPRVSGEVDINGNRGIYDGITHFVCWAPDPRTTIFVNGDASTGEDALLRVARSVRPVAGRVTMPLWPRGNDLPPLASTIMDGDLTRRWTCTLTFKNTIGGSFRIDLGTAIVPPPGGVPVRVRGRAGRHISTVKHTPGSFPADGFTRVEPSTHYAFHVVVNLGRGLWLTVTYSGTDAPPPSAATLLRIAEETGVRAVNLSWLGSGP